jgi:Tol biopolymer transport system component
MLPSQKAPLTAGLAAAAALVAATFPAAADTSTEGSNHLVALDNEGHQAADKSYINGSAQVTTAGGRYVVFSTTSALVAEDTNGLSDVYLRDTVEERTTLVSISYYGKVGNGDSFEPTISADGTIVAFTTAATNLVTGDSSTPVDANGHVLDVVAKQVQGGIIGRVSARTDGTQAKRNSFFPVISGDGLVVGFQTFGRFAGSDRDLREDVYVRSLKSGSTWHISRDSGNRDIPASVLIGDVSQWGQWVTFGNANNIWVRNRATGTTRRIWHEDNDPAQPFPMGSAGRPVISGDGRFVAFSTMSRAIMKGEKGHRSDIFRIHLGSGTVNRVVVAADGGQGDGDSFIPSLSYGGRYVGFSSFAGNLVPGDAPGSDTYVRDMRTGTTYLASKGVDGPADQESGRTAVSISDNGRTLVYESYASNLVAGDVNGMPEVFAWRR